MYKKIITIEMEKEKRYRIDVRRSKRGTIVQEYWSYTPEPKNWSGFITIYEKRGKRMYKISDNFMN